MKSNEETNARKKNYEAPELVLFGEVEKLTGQNYSHGGRGRNDESHDRLYIDIEGPFGS